ncbi:MAG: CPBP family intramembrane glutamic endopeptidase [Patescibacteria group bacterium]
MSTTLKNRYILIAFSALEIAIVLLLSAGIIQPDLRFYFLAIFGFITLVCSLILEDKKKTLGFRIDNIKSAMLVNLAFVIVCSLFIFIARELNLVRYVSDNIPLASWYILYALLLGPIQEFIFRGFLFYRLNSSGIKPVFQIIISGLLFGFIHLIYGDLWTLIFATVFGIFLSTIYYFKPNLYAIIFSHSIIGALAIYLRII